ncbi:hypothetical protein MLD38_010736 [Melastoma candidum]|uniref:Uncharacterized protein n=1 Tax=Melastoma candidum TaxID=119954 RepID=A0ACB9R3W8_9MYRT|nr:hypothetical protein MLD38_010736 [Melastoma candidum]
MKPLSRMISFIVLVLTIHPSLTHSSRPNNLVVVDQTCKRTSFPSFCASALLSDPRVSGARSPQALGLIMASRVGSKAESALAKVKALVPSTRDPRAKKALSYCGDVYEAMVIGMVPASKDSLAKGDYKFAQQYMTDAANEVLACEDGFRGSKSPLSGENDFVHKAASVVASIAQSLL